MLNSESPSCVKCGAELAAFATEGFCSACLLERGLSSAPAVATPPLSRFGNYELIEEIARGGMGVVYKARQAGLDRLVAVKMILSGQFASAAEMRRFRAEARAAAALQHPGIVAIHEVGEHEGLLYFSMDYVEGRNLAQLIRDGPWPGRRAAECVRNIAEAIHYAHEHGVLHRDLKPSNVLVDASGKTRVTDFGLAKQFSTSVGTRSTASQIASKHDGDSVERVPTDELTLSGQVLGSPNFMSPEQAAGRHRELTPASDVYSLGGLLYHLLTGRPPFLADNIPATLRLVSETEPVAPRLLAPGVPRDLETICLKSLEKEPVRRYASAKDLADELERFLCDEPIRAQPVGVAVKVHRWCLRNKALAFAGTAILALLFLVAIISTVAATRLNRANREGQEKLRAAYLSEARALRWSGREGRRFDSLDAIRKAVAIRPGPDLRDEAIAAMALVDLRHEREWTGGMVFDPAFERYAQADTNGDMVVRRTADDTLLMRLPAGRFPPFEFSFNPDGRLLAVHYRGNGGSNYDFKVYDLKKTGSLVFDLPGRWVRMWRFSPDSRRLAVAWRDLSDTSKRNNVSFFDLTAGQEVNSFTTKRLPWGIAFSPDGNQLALSSAESRSVQVHSVPDGKVLRTLMHSNGVRHLIWSSDGRRLASACHDGHIYLWDMTTPSPSPQLLPHGSAAVTCVFTPREDMLMSFGWNSLAKLWEVQTGRELLRISCHAFPGFSSDGRRAIVQRRSDTTGLSEFAGGEECRSFTFGSETTGAYVCFSPDGRWMASAHRDGLRLWDLATGREKHYADSGEIGGLQFTRDGSALICQSASQIMSWPVRSSVKNEMTRIEVGPPSFWLPKQIEASRPANRMLMIVQSKACLFDASSLAVERYITTPPGVFGGKISGDGRYVATWSRDTSVVNVWDAGDGRHLAVPATNHSPCAAFSPDNRWLITGSTHDYTLWEVGTWIRKRTIPRGDTDGPGGIIAFSKDGAVMALSLVRGEVGLFDATTFELLARFEPRDVNAVRNLDFSADGSKLAVGTSGNTIHVWDLRLVRQRLAELGLDIPRPPFPPASPPAGPLELGIVGVAGKQAKGD